jgi:hypothetical protein
VTTWLHSFTSASIHVPRPQCLRMHHEREHCQRVCLIIDVDRLSVKSCCFGFRYSLPSALSSNKHMGRIRIWNRMKYPTHERVKNTSRFETLSDAYAQSSTTPLSSKHIEPRPLGNTMVQPSLPEANLEARSAAIRPSHRAVNYHKGLDRASKSTMAPAIGLSGQTPRNKETAATASPRSKAAS